MLTRRTSSLPLMTGMCRDRDVVIVLMALPSVSFVSSGAQVGTPSTNTWPEECRLVPRPGTRSPGSR